MMLDPIIECVYGWGQMMSLYDDHLNIGGTSYALMDLISVHPVYYHTLGVSSARLELCFKHKRVVLRGIAAIDIAQRVASYLSAFCHLQTPPSVPVISKTRVDQASWCADLVEGSRQTDDVFQDRKVQLAAPVTDSTKHEPKTEEHDLKEPGKTPVLKLLRWQSIGQEQRLRRMKRLQAERAQREHGFDVEQLALRLQAETLPQVYVPTRLLPGEYAHYCTDATLCEEHVSSTKQPDYRVKDQGMLILTARRMIYIGRRRQLVLDYSRLMHVSRLQGAIAVLSESWARPELFEVRFPLECTMYLDAILLRYRKEPANQRTHSRVRQLYPSTKTNSYGMYTTSDNAQSEAQAQWRSLGPSNK